ncbi:hypothetical protein [Luteitalea sp.]|jgi:uncharacterized membrane protein|uniref:hypothetical protein n=1 Tax=Luteitalea sp. TaxID=2004800 RepID=UPI0037C71F60
MAKLPARPSGPALPTAPERTSLGLTPRQAALLAYSAGWISGVLVLWLESRDRPSRWHAAQSVLGFGVLSVIGAFTLGIAAIGLLSSLALFRAGLWATQGIVVIGLLLWAWSLAKVAVGGVPRWPMLGDRVDRLAEPH